MPGLGAAALGLAGAVGAGAIGSAISGKYSQQNKEIEGTNQLANTFANSLGQFVNNSASQAMQGIMGANANAVSAQAQMAAGAFNQGSADLANAIDSGRLTSQYGFNSAQAAMANDFNSMMWDKAAGWNEEMWEKQAAFNAEQAQIQRDWSERMENTRYQRTINDMEKAGLNPILAVTGGGGMATGAGNAQAASVSGAQMNSASANMAQGGLLGAESAYINGYQGQMEFTGACMNVLSKALEGIGSAQMAMSMFGEEGMKMLNSLLGMFGQDPHQNESKKPALDWQYNANNKSKGTYADEIKRKHQMDKDLYGY